MAFGRIIVIGKWGSMRKELIILSPNPSEGAEENYTSHSIHS
jgi:hypothetical protein